MPLGGLPDACRLDPSGDECTARFYRSDGGTDFIAMGQSTVLTIGAAGGDPAPSAEDALAADPRVFGMSVLLNASVLERCIPGRPADDENWTQLSSPWRRARDCFWPVDPELERVCSLPGW